MTACMAHTQAGCMHAHDTCLGAAHWCALHAHCTGCMPACACGVWWDHAAMLWPHAHDPPWKGHAAPRRGCCTCSHACMQPSARKLTVSGLLCHGAGTLCWLVASACGRHSASQRASSLAVSGPPPASERPCGTPATGCGGALQRPGPAMPSVLLHSLDIPRYCVPSWACVGIHWRGVAVTGIL